MIKNRCPICGNYAVLLKGQDMCWDCYIAEGRFEPKGEEWKKIIQDYTQSPL